MARWVVSLPGAGGGADESTLFSGWIQPDDQSARMALDGAFADGTLPVEQRTAAIEEEVADPPLPFENYPVDLRELATTLMGGFDGVPAAGMGASFFHQGWTLRSGQLGDDDDPFYYTHNLSGERGGSALSPHVNAADLFWKDLWLPAPRPVGVIGYEVETVDVPFAWTNPQTGEDELSTASWPLADPVSCDLTVSLQTATGTGDNGGSIEGLIVRVDVHDVYGSGDPVFRSEAGVTWFEFQGTHPNSLIAKATHGLAEHPVVTSGTEAEPTLYHFTVDDFSTVPQRTGAFGLSVGMTAGAGGVVAPLVGADNTVQTVEGLNYWGAYVIRPPRFRWIFGTPTEVTYRRTYPRDDGLAGGSAPRTWPPSKAAQSSNRTFGGYL